MENFSSDLLSALSEISNDSYYIRLQETGIASYELFSLFRECFYDRDEVQKRLGRAYFNLKKYVDQYLLIKPLTKNHIELLSGKSQTNIKNELVRRCNKIAVIDQNAYPVKLVKILRSRNETLEYYRFLIETDNNPDTQNYFKIVPDEFLFDCAWIYVFRQGTIFEYNKLYEKPFAIHPYGYEFYYFDDNFFLDKSGLFSKNISYFFSNEHGVNREHIQFCYEDNELLYIMYEGIFGQLWIDTSL